MDPIILQTAGDPAAVVVVAEEQLAGLGFKLTRQPDGWSGTAEVGSSVGRALGGGFVRRMKLSWSVSAGPTPGVHVLTVASAMSGMSGGALGVSKARKEMDAVRGAVGGTLQQQGLLAPH